MGSGAVIAPKRRRLTTPDPARDGTNWLVYCAANPVGRWDPNGYFWETFFDILSLTADAASLNQNIKDGNTTDAIVDACCIVADVVGAILPFIPAEAGNAARIVRQIKSTAETAAGVGTVISGVDNVSEGIQQEDTSKIITGGLQVVTGGLQVGNGVNSIKHLSKNRQKYYLVNAIQGKNENQVLLGCQGSYETDGYTHFSMPDKLWDAFEMETCGNYDEMWKVNQMFIDEQIEAGKSIFLANNPNIEYLLSNGEKRFFQRELDYLRSQGFDFVPTTNGLWEAIKLQ